MEVNPVAIASYLLDIRRKKIPTFQEELAKQTETLFAKKLYKLYLNLLTDHIVEESYVLEGKLNGYLRIINVFSSKFVKLS